MDTHTITTTYKWRIDNTAKRLSDIEEAGSIVSNVFSLNDSSGAKFVLKLSCDEEDGLYDLHLACNDMGRNEKIRLIVKNWLENSNGIIERMQERTRIFNRTGMLYLLSDQPVETINNFAINDVLFIFCEVQREVPINDCASVEKELHGREEIGRKMLELHSNGHYDLTIQVGDKEFKISKFNLMACSEVFNRMLSCQNSTEAQTGIVKITDTSPEAIEAMINWIYQVKISNITEIAMDLYKIADKYDINLLKEKCVKVMSNELSSENLPLRFILAYEYNEEQLKECALNFLRTNSKNIRELMTSDEWINLIFNDVALAKKITTDIFE